VIKLLCKPRPTLISQPSKLCRRWCLSVALKTTDLLVMRSGCRLTCRDEQSYCSCSKWPPCRQSSSSWSSPPPWWCVLVAAFLRWSE